jgi:hypothetical protein
MDRPWWFHFKAVLVVLGALASLVTVQTGIWAHDMFPADSPLHPVIDLHMLFGKTVAWIFCVLAGAYIFAAWRRYGAPAGFFGQLGRFADWLIRSPIIILPALIGFVFLILTGTLGGIIVYGPTLDPATQFVYKLFF